MYNKDTTKARLIILLILATVATATAITQTIHELFN